MISKKFKVKNLKFSVITLFTFAFLLLTFPTAALAATLGVSPATGTFNKSCSFTITIEVDTSNTDTDGTDAILAYDPSRLSATQVLNGTVYSEYPGSNIDSKNGKITVTGLASSAAPFSGKGNLATVNFTVLDTAQIGATALTFDFDPQDKTKTTDSNVIQRGTIADVLTSVTNGSYTIGSGSCAKGSTGTTVVSGTPSGSLQTGGGTKGGLPEAGTEQFTAMIAIVGGILTILGILGLAIL